VTPLNVNCVTAVVFKGIVNGLVVSLLSYNDTVAATAGKINEISEQGCEALSGVLRGFKEVREVVIVCV
jgi:hypothetical protein